VAAGTVGAGDAGSRLGAEREGFTLVFDQSFRKGIPATAILDQGTKLAHGEIGLVDDCCSHRSHNDRSLLHQ
jgi:hypothetical protein